MAVVEGPVHEVGLALQHAYPVVELGCYVEGLVTAGVVFADEGGVVSANFGDVGVATGAEFGIVVAWLRVCGSG